MSNMKKMLVRAKAGERLERIELLAGRQKEVSFRLSTHRVGQPRMIIGDEEAQRAFAREVAASLGGGGSSGADRTGRVRSLKKKPPLIRRGRSRASKKRKERRC